MNLKTSNEPVLVAHGTAAVLGWAATFLVSHGVVTGAQASTLVQTIAPSAVSAALVGLGLFVRKFVSPAWKVAVKDAAQVGINLTGVNEATALLAQLGLDAEGNPIVAAPDGPVAAAAVPAASVEPKHSSDPYAGT